MTIVPKNRRFDLDWLRVLSVLLLVPFHTALVFNPDPNSIVYLKDTLQSNFLSHLAGFIHVWHMPLLFFISGASTWFALNVRPAQAYAKERVLRLLVPFLAGLAVLIPSMTYLQFLTQPSPPALWQHYARFFSRITDLKGVDGYLTPAHLWFILYLFIFSLLGLPFILWLRSEAGRKWIKRLGGVLSLPGLIFLLFIPLALAAASDILGDQNPLYYFSVFLLGYVLIADERIQRAIDRQAGSAIVLGLAAYALRISLYYNSPPPAEWSLTWIAVELLYQFARWACTVGILGLGHRWLQSSTPLLGYLNRSSYPFYLLHLPCVTLMTFFVIQLDASAAVKFLLIVTSATLLSFAAYELIRRVKGLGFFFGVK